MQHQATGSPPTSGSSTASMNPQVIWCKVCNICCNSLDMLDKHKMGKKHKRNLERLRSARGPAPASPALPNNTIIGAPSPAPAHVAFALPNKQLGDPYQNHNPPTFNSSVVSAAATSAPSYNAAYYAQEKMYAQAVSEGATSTAGYQQNPDIQNLPNPFASGVAANGSKQVVAVQGNPISLGKLYRVYICEVCEIECTSKELLDMHNLGKKHKKNVEKQKATHGDPISLENNQKKRKLHEAYFCEVCKIECNRLELLNMHNLGKKHKKNVEKQKAAQGDPHFCEVCVIECNRKELLDMHNLGKKHKKNVEKQKAAQGDPHFCEVCEIECTSKDLLDMHNMGKKHKKKVEKQKAALSLAPVTPPAPAHSEEEHSSRI